MDFQRARSDSQREQRRQSILSTAAAMLVEVPVAQLSLNELSRRVGLAKSNVLRYFVSREAILLELLDEEVRRWSAELTTTLQPVTGSVRERVDLVAAALAESLASRPMMCDLVSAQTSILEHNITAEVALQHKRAITAPLQDIAAAVHRVLPEVDTDDAAEGLGVGLFLVGTAWPHSRPSAALQAAYETDPAIAADYRAFEPLVRRSFELAFSGLIARVAVDDPIAEGAPR